MAGSTEPAKHRFGLLGMAGLPQDLAIDDDDGVGRNDDHPVSHGRLRLGAGDTQHVVERLLVGMAVLVDVRRHHVEPDAEGRQELAPPR
jgi:hypothetical protein